VTEYQPVTARAAVLASEEQPISVQGEHGGYDDAWPTFSPNHKRDVTTKIVLLQPGNRAAALGRGALREGSPGWVEAGLTGPQRVRTRLPNWMAIVLSHAGKERLFDDNHIPGPIDVPVWVDPASGQVLSIDGPALEQQILQFRELAERIWRDEDGFMRTPRAIVQAPKSAFHFAKGLKKAWGGVVDDIKDIKNTGAPPPGARPATEPIEGVDYRAWVIVKGGLTSDEVHVSHVDLYAGYRGVPAGRWPAVDQQWSARVAQDAALAAWAAFDLRRMSQTGATWLQEPSRVNSQ
jgi:hypothetical protein